MGIGGLGEGMETETEHQEAEAEAAVLLLLTSGGSRIGLLVEDCDTA